MVSRVSAASATFYGITEKKKESFGEVACLIQGCLFPPPAEFVSNLHLAFFSAPGPLRARISVNTSPSSTLAACRQKQSLAEPLLLP